MRLSCLLVVIATAPGCYRFVPETAPEPQIGTVYRAHLTPSGTTALTPYLGRDVVTVDGTMLRATDSAFAVAMAQSMSRTEQRPTLWAGEEMLLPRLTIERFERRELDGKRSLRAGSLLAVGALVSAKLWFTIRGKATGDPNIGPGPISP